jgi:hypothetical protein
MVGRSQPAHKVMENSTPFDLNDAIRRWQEGLAVSPALGADDLEELAAHLRASIQQLHATGVSQEESFHLAVQRIGECNALQREFAKLKPVKAEWWSVLLFWTATGILLIRLLRPLLGVLRSYWELLLVKNWDAYSLLEAMGGMALCLASVLLVLLLVLCCWQLIMGSRKKRDALFVARFQAFTQTRFTLSELTAIVSASLVTILPTISGVIAIRMNPTFGKWGFIWPIAVRHLAINFVLALIVVFLARRGLRSSPKSKARCN